MSGTLAAHPSMQAAAWRARWVAEEFEPSPGTRSATPSSPHAAVPMQAAIVADTAAPSEIETARELAREEGRREALASQQAAEHARVVAAAEVRAAALARIADALSDQLADMAATASRERAEAAEALADCVVAALRTAFPALAASSGAADAAAFATRLAAALVGQDALVLRVAPADHDAVEAALASLSGGAVSGEVAVTLLADAALESGDVRATWQDGFARRDAAALHAEVLRLVSGIARESAA